MKQIKICEQCLKEKTIDDFYFNDAKKTKLKKICKKCHVNNSVEIRRKDPYRKIKQRERYKENPNLFKNRQLKHFYGIDLKEYNDLLNKQNNVCAICKEPEKIIDNRNNKLRDLAVDHCHKTGKIRGLLCYDCNTSLGKLKDNISIIKRVLTYLESNQ